MLESSVRAAFIALGTAAILRALRVKSAGARHAAWAGVVVLMLLLPSWMAWGPRASQRVLPAAPAPAAGVPIVLSTLDPPSIPAVRVEPSARWDWLAIVYLAGVFFLLLRLAIGTLRAHILAGGATVLGGRLTSPRCAAPVTVGWLRPSVILPECWRQWPQAQFDAVLTHESEHVRRRDPLFKWLALLNRAIFWFHPLAWWLERRLSALAEEACDAAVLERGHDPHEYSRYLLELARSVGQMGARIDVVGMAMPGSSLTRRIRQILASGPAPRLTRGRAVCLAVAFAMLSAVFAAARVDRQPSVPDPPMPPAPHAAPLQAAAPAPAPTPQPPQEKRLIVLYFDLYGTSHAIVEATSYVQTQLGPADLAAIVTSGDEVRVVQDFTADRDKLIGDIQQLTFSGVEEAEPGKSLDGLYTAVRILRSLAEKKMVVFFMPLSFHRAVAREQALLDAALRANVGFYGIDVSVPDK
jgi:hypothetical protein